MRKEFVVEQIGIIRTPFVAQQDTPIQPSGARGAEGVVEVNLEYEEGLKDIEGFERIWLLYWFDRAGPMQLSVIPYLDNEKRGLFATRAPVRPNCIGLSSVKLLRREGNLLFISDVDMLDRTPLLDIKPYAPRFDVYEVKKTGWLQGRTAEGMKADQRFQSS